MSPCRGQQVYGFSPGAGLFQFEGGAWISLGTPPWHNPEAVKGTQGPVLLEGGLLLAKDLLFFFSTDVAQEDHYLSTYDLTTGVFEIAAKPVFSQKWIAYDEQNDLLMGTVSSGLDGDRHLMHYDYKTGEILRVHHRPFEDEIRGFDAASGMVLSSGYQGLMYGTDVDNQTHLPGTPKKISLAARVDEGSVAFVIPARNGKASELCLLQIDNTLFEQAK